MPRNVSTAARGSGERRLSRNEPGPRLRHADQRLDRGRRRAAAAAPAVAGRGRGALLDQPPEHRVGGVLRDALAERERQVAQVEVARPPAQHRRVEGDHERVAAGRLRPADQALDQLVGRRPVQLEPARRVAHRRGALLHRHRRLVGEDHRHARGDAAARATARSASSCTSSSAPDRREQQRGGQPSSEQLDRGVAAADVAQHPGDDGPPVERRPVGPLRDLVARAAGHVGVGARVQRLLRPRLQRPHGRRHARGVAVHARPVDLVLPTATGARCGRPRGHRSQANYLPTRRATRPPPRDRGETFRHTQVRMTRPGSGGARNRRAGSPAGSRETPCREGRRRELCAGWHRWSGDSRWWAFCSPPPQQLPTIRRGRTGPSCRGRAATPAGWRSAWSTARCPTPSSWPPPVRPAARTPPTWPPARPSCCTPATSTGARPSTAGWSSPRGTARARRSPTSSPTTASPGRPRTARRSPRLSRRDDDAPRPGPRPDDGRRPRPGSATADPSAPAPAPDVPAETPSRGRPAHRGR